MPPPPKFASFIPQKRHTPLFYRHSDFLFLSTNFQMPEAVLSSKFGSMVVSEPVLLNPTKSNNVSRIAQSEHLCSSILVGLPHT